MAFQRYRPIPTGSTRQSIYVEMKDPVTPFQPKSGFAFNTSGIVLSYCKKRGARVAITPVTQTVTGAWVSGGVIEVDATNMTGVVRFDLPDAAFAPDGVSDEVIFAVKATGYEPMMVSIPLSDPAKRDTALLQTTVRTNN